MAVPTQVLSMRIPVGSELQVRVATAARKAGILPWQLLVQMLDAWEQQHDEPPAETWQEVVSGLKAEINSLRDELNATKKQILHDIDIVDKVDNANKENVLGEFQNIVDNVDNIDNANIEAFDAAYTELDQGLGVLFYKLRNKLAWSSKRFDAVVCQLRDAGRYEPIEGAELEGVPDKEERIAGAFFDEGGRRHLMIRRLPAASLAPIAAPMGESEPEPEALAVLAPESEAPKPQNQKGRGKKAEAVGATEATIEETKKQRRG